ncbi:Peptidyl-prolyl isomerase cwc27 [Kickxella alabastrina]|uniref:Peptidyl-prolyl isomerase cwc27 n=1 Tax=Kickxella alabastrina TaxID=61397 RepID=A0ACC1ICX0_9FUNG|nr:Peptidyl-prolyl isomerase cwc27 [Kickxella alabastrina]
MSSIYVSEPPTSGKVVLETSAGDIEVELWSKEAPKACRNFIQLCVDGYYDTTIFHRLVSGWIVQGGDPTGTGEGGESIYGAPFADEFHSRLRFSRRGLLGMANTGPNDNGSQFFITLAPTPELQKKNTIFGTVVGDSLFNALKLGSGEVDNVTERPVHLKTLKHARVLDNPFPDIVPRATAKYVAAPDLDQSDAAVATALKKKRGRNIKAVKNKKLLSFADDDDEDYDDTMAHDSKAGAAVATRTEMKSSHDLLKSDPMLSKETSSAASPVPLKPVRGLNSIPELPPKEAESVVLADSGSTRADTPSVREKIQSVENEIKKLAERDNKRKSTLNVDSGESKKPKSALSEMLSRYKTAGPGVRTAARKKDTGREDELFVRLGSFQSKIRNTKGFEKPAAGGNCDTEAGDNGRKCELHGVAGCNSCQRAKPDEYSSLGKAASRFDGGDWLSHTLKFSNRKEKGSASEYAPRVEDYVVIDPREQEQKFLKRNQK